MQLDMNFPDRSWLLVSRSTDGGQTFTAPYGVAYGNVHFPGIAADANTGRVSVTWVNVAQNDIRAAHSSNFGDTFGSHEVAWVGGDLLTRAPGWALNAIARAPSIPMIRYNHIANRLTVVYHARNGSNLTDVFVTYSPCSTNCNFWNWEIPKLVNDNTTNDQFFPGIDYTSAGNLVVTLYDRREDGNNRDYQQYFAYLTSTGDAIAGEPNRRICRDAACTANNPNAAGAGDPFRNFIGDYQDVWTDTYPSEGNAERGISAWIGIGNVEDTYLSRIWF